MPVSNAVAYGWYAGVLKNCLINRESEFNKEKVAEIGGAHVNFVCTVKESNARTGELLIWHNKA